VVMVSVGLARRATITTRPVRKPGQDRLPPAELVEVPNVANSVEIWQTFRDNWSKAVIFGQGPADQALERGAAVAGFGNHAEAGVGFDGLPQALTKQGMVICDQNAYFARHGARPGTADI